MERKRQTGNKERATLVGVDQIYLAILLFAFPEVEFDEIIVFLYDRGGNIYSREAISKRLKEFKVSRKKSSIEAFQAYTAVNQAKADFFWSQGPPLGVYGLLRALLIDFDECGIEISRLNRGTGLASVGVRVRRPGHYERVEKLTLICAVEPGDPTIPPGQDGSVENPRRWFRINHQAGTTAFEFADFCNEVCTDIETNPAGDVDRDRVFLWDNLSSHLSPIVIQTVEGRPTRPHNRFRIVQRPPYRPWLGPIEVIFCELACELIRRIQDDWDLNTLEQEIRNVLSTIGRDGKFNKTFAHCGY